MSRFSDDGEDDFNNQGLMWWHNVEQAIAGRKGRKVLEELRATLLALPEKRLIHGHLCDGQDVCAVGALVVARRVAAGEERAAVMAALGPPPDIDCRCMHPRGSHPEDGPCAVCAKNLEEWIAANPGKMEHAEYNIWTCKAYDRDLEYEDAWDTLDVATKHGIPRLPAFAIEYHNDEEEDSGITPEQRYENTLRWIDRQLARPLLVRPPRRERKRRRTPAPPKDDGQLLLEGVSP